MSHMGLPVPAAGSYIPQFDTLHVYRPKRHMDAGGLEGFLREFLPLCLDAGSRSLVLADELEAMTELEASVKIIRSFLRELETRCAFSVVVTHLAAEVAGGHPFRIDGIEAKGLDDGFNLIVDRTPKICHQARSMPELILKRLLGRSKGPEKELYGRVLSEFTPPSS
jgi:DNA mismatch repair protein MutS2